MIPNLPAVPTDNLYKFCFIFGIVLIVFSQYFSWNNRVEFRKQYNDIDSLLSKNSSIEAKLVAEVHEKVPKLPKQLALEATNRPVELTASLKSVQNLHGDFKEYDKIVSTIITSHIDSPFNSVQKLEKWYKYFYDAKVSIRSKITKPFYPMNTQQQVIDYYSDMTVLYSGYEKDLRSKERLIARAKDYSNDVVEARQIAKLCLWLGYATFFLGALLWYWFTQRPADQLQRTQLQISELDLWLKQNEKDKTNPPSFT